MHFGYFLPRYFTPWHLMTKPLSDVRIIVSETAKSSRSCLPNTSIWPSPWTKSILHYMEMKDQCLCLPRDGNFCTSHSRFHIHSPCFCSSIKQDFILWLHKQHCLVTYTSIHSRNLGLSVPWTPSCWSLGGEPSLSDSAPYVSWVFMTDRPG